MIRNEKAQHQRLNQHLLESKHGEPTQIAILIPTIPSKVAAP
jgi:hypothetical protein